MTREKTNVQAVPNVGEDLKREPVALQVEVDRASQLPLLDFVVHDVGTLLHSNGYLGIVLVDLEPLSEIEADCGRTIYNQLITRIAGELGGLRTGTIRHGDLLCCLRPLGEQFAVFLEGGRTPAPFGATELEAVADRIWAALASRVTEHIRTFDSQMRFRLGYALVLPNGMIQTERLIYRGLDQARMMSQDYSRRINARRRERLRDLIVQRQLTTVFQPILEMAGRKVCAYEALIRGPAGSEVASPNLLFNLAAHAELVPELDRACCECTFTSAAGMPKEVLLFANVVPALINDPLFRAQVVNQGVYGVDPKRLVLELNEGVAIRSYEVLSHGIAELRAHGVRVAVDDLGAGYANLDYVLRLRPDFLKLDISLIHGVHESPVKRALVSSMVEVGHAVGATLIAEGIEERAEYEALVSLGVRWGQGFLFARPSAGFQKPSCPAP